MKQFNNIN